MDYTEIKKKLRVFLSEKRYKHSIGVAEFAKELSTIYAYNEEKAYIAGLLHDCARDLEKEKLKEYAPKCGIKIGEIEEIHPVLLHAPVGACMAREIFGITDKEILRAISSHTVLNENPTLLDKIIYVADLGEPERGFEESKQIREMAIKSLNEAVIFSIDISFKYLIQERRLIHPLTLFARNLLLKEVYYGKNRL